MIGAYRVVFVFGIQQIEIYLGLGYSLDPKTDPWLDWEPFKTNSEPGHCYCFLKKDVPPPPPQTPENIEKIRTFVNADLTRRLPSSSQVTNITIQYEQL